MMFEKKIISLLNKLLKPFIDGIDENTLHLRNILSGKVVLTGLRLKPNIVHSLGLPYHMTFGLIDDVSLTIHLPLLSLSKRKLVIEINNVIMLLTALPESQWDPAQYREEHFTNKVATLAAESLQQVVTEIEGGGFIWRTVLSLLENLEVRINNIHLRVEDYTTNPRLSYAFGCVVKKALFLTGVDPATQAKRDAARDTPFHRSFYNDGNMLHPNVIHRRIEVSEVGVYIDRLDPLRPGMMPSDSVRNGPLSDGASLHPEENIYAPAPDAEDPLFMDARSHGSCNSARYGNVGSSGYIHFVRVSRRPGPSYCAARKNKACRKEFRIKCCRPGDAPRNRLRFVRYSLDPLLQESLCPPRPVNALACTNALFGGLISRIMAHLSSGDHTADCEGGNRTGWQQRSQRTLTRAARRSRRSSGNIFTAGYNRLNAVLAEGKHMGKKDRAMHRGLRRLLPDMRPLVRDRHHPLTPSGLPAGSSNTGSGTRRCGSHLCCGACLCCDGASACSSRTDADASLANSLGYTLSSGSTWRILLSTFCEIRQPEEEHQYECLEMINKAQARYIHRHRGKNCDSPRDDCTIRHLNSNVSVKLPNDKPKPVMEFVAAPVNDATEKPDEPTAEGLDPSDTAESSRCFGICSNGDCVLSEGDTDAFDESEYNADRNAPLSYDETWHTQGLDGGTMHTNPQDGDTQDSDADSSKGENDPGYPKNFKPVGESWTRFTFMMNPKEDPAMKELFFRLLDEANHNYVINPKECNGVVSFYFCVYPIRPAIRPRSCWSEWGRRHDSKLYKESIALAKEYLPTCSVFVHLEGLNVIISKDQLECLFNLLFEGIVKYFSWQSGIIHTVEHPRPTPEDEQLYMEYWPQHLLLGQSSQKSEIREFIMDFEILHSIQATRILRKNTSEALRKLIHTFGDRTSSCCDARGCLTDVLLTNICGNCDLDETDPEDDKEEHSRLQARLKLVGGIYEIATKHAKTNAFLDSLRKICQPSMLTFDFTLDVILTESRVALTFEVEPRETNSLSAKAYVFSTKGLHVFFTDVYGRDGCQVIEGELLPFSVVNFAFSIDHHNAEYHSLNDCPCQFLDAPATLLLACGDTPVPKDTAPAGVNNIPGTTVPRHSRISDVIFRSISDSNMYIGISFNRYCTPNDADVRLLFNLNCDLFGHLNLLDEYGDYLRMKKHNQSQNDTVSPVLVGAQKKIYQLSQDSTGCYNEVYELIDLGGEYYRNLLQGSLPYMNLYMFMEVSNQVALFVGACSKYSRLPYVLTVDSFAMTSDITPRQYEPQAEPPYDSHLARASNIRLMSVNGDYSFLVDGGRREVYLGHGTTVKLSDYLAMACSTTRRRGCNDPVIALSLSKLQNNFEILSLGRDNEIFVKQA
ncbi:chloroquine resistance marker protein, putative [Babesia ovis]|uniref:Chloroquine resistance marker protein, putative n=1 Tax=Babesia ovis TaxID=5869 RepID=A0A9W5WWD3_BABOV|nr:chloroquine resistance marker protein, putative [Babesia ovis]